MFTFYSLSFPILYLPLRTHSSLSAFPVFPHSQLLSASHIVSDSDSRLPFYRLIFAHPPLILSPSHVLLRPLLIASLPRSKSTMSTWTRYETCLPGLVLHGQNSAPSDVQAVHQSYLRASSDAQFPGFLLSVSLRKNSSAQIELYRILMSSIMQ